MYLLHTNHAFCAWIREGIDPFFINKIEWPLMPIADHYHHIIGTDTMWDYHVSMIETSQLGLTVVLIWSCLVWQFAYSHISACSLCIETVSWFCSSMIDNFTSVKVCWGLKGSVIVGISELVNFILVINVSSVLGDLWFHLSHLNWIGWDYANKNYDNSKSWESNRKARFLKKASKIHTIFSVEM